MSREDEIVIVPLRIGIRFSPPALVYVYEKNSLDSLKPSVLRRRIMPVRDFFQSSDIESTAKTLLERHGKHLFRNVPIQTICKMLRLLREHRNGLDLKTALELVDEEENEIQGITDMLKKTDDKCQRDLDSPKDNTCLDEKEDTSKIPADTKEVQDLDVENTWDDDDGEYSLEFPLDKIVT